MSGFMPSGRAHFGHMMVMNEIIWHQQQGGDAFAAIADMEAHAVRGISWERCRALGINEYILSLIALGFAPREGSHIYFQSENYSMRNLAFELGSEANFSEVSAIYGFSGETHISHMESVMAQSADILHPQLKEFGGPKPVVIPVGADQDPHIKLTRDLAYRMRKFLVELRGDYISIRGKAASPELMQAAEAALKDLAAGKVKRYEEHIDLTDIQISDDTGLAALQGTIDRLIINLEIDHGHYGFMPPASTLSPLHDRPDRRKDVLLQAGEPHRPHRGSQGGGQEDHAGHNRRPPEPGMSRRSWEASPISAPSMSFWYSISQTMIKSF